MKNSRTIIFAVAILAFGGGLYGVHLMTKKEKNDGTLTSGTEVSSGVVKLTGATTNGNTASMNNAVVIAEPLPDFVIKGMDWLIAAQNDDGSWGAGSHSRQDIHDPHAVKADPATTAFCGLALIRGGNSYQDGKYTNNLNKALLYLLKTVEESEENTPNITSLTGTQPQTKLGSQIDVTFTSQFLTRSLEMLNHDVDLSDRTGEALQKCLRKIEKSQQANGSWTTSGWAPVLQSQMATNALEQASGKGYYKGDSETFANAKSYQKANVNIATGAATSSDGAGVDLYVISSSNRATAKDSREAEEHIERAKSEGKLAKDATVSEENLRKAGVEGEKAKELDESYQYNSSTARQLQSDAVLSGFGNNGGEEFLSYMMTSESSVIASDTQWSEWKEKMGDRLPKIQNTNGSWSGHHCITSPVFCTAAVILTMTAGNDKNYLIAQNTNDDSDGGK